MRLIEVIKGAGREDLRNGLSWLFWALIGGMMPMWLLLIALVCLRQPLSLDAFAGAGQFALYAAAISSASIYVMMKETKLAILPPEHADHRLAQLLRGFSISFPSFRLLMSCAITVMVLSAVTFMLITLVGLLSSVSPDLSTYGAFVSWLTTLMLLVSSALGFAVTVADSVTMDEQEFMGSRRDQYRSFEEGFDKLDEGS